MKVVEASMYAFRTSTEASMEVVEFSPEASSMELSVGAGFTTMEIVEASMEVSINCTEIHRRSTRKATWVDRT